MPEARFPTGRERRRRARCRAIAAAIAGAVAAGPLAAQDGADSQWLELFDGSDLDGWVAKIRGYPAGENFAQTFRAADGVIRVSYDGYQDFAERFGHLFYSIPYSHYRLHLEYRFTGEQAPNAPQWALRNSGVMLHSQAPDSMRPGQDFPVSIEVQFLGGLRQGEPRTTGNVCTPGTHIVFDGQFTDVHCIDSSSATYYGDQWVESETLVLGGEHVEHFINGEKVIEYGGITTGGGVVSDFDPSVRPEGRPLESGYIALQSEGHPVEFRRIRLLNLKGCMDPAAANFRARFVAPDPAACRYE